MKIKLEISDENYAFIANTLIEKGFEISDDAKFILREKGCYSSYICCRKNESSYHLPTSEILYIESMGHYITAHTKDGDYKCSDTLAQLEKSLNPSEFIRISKSVIISKKSVVGIRAALSQKFTVKISNGDKVDVTRSYYYGFKNFFGI